MFKTVRKGDASLQYTILPQTDQFFHGNTPSPQPPDTRQSLFYELMIPSIVIGFCFCSMMALSALLIMKPHESNSVNVSELQQVEYKDVKLNNQLNYQQTTAANPMDTKESEVLSTNIALEVNFNLQTTDNSMVPKILETLPDDDDKFPEIMDTITDYTSPENKLILTEIGISSPPSDNLKSNEHSEIPVTVLPLTILDTSSPSSSSSSSSSSLSLSFTSSDSKSTVLNDSMTTAMNFTNVFEKKNLSHVALKLPECSICDSAIYALLKRYCETGGRAFALGLSFGVTASMIYSMIVHAKLKMTRMRWTNEEEPPINEKDDEEQEDRSKPIEPETKLIDEKE